MTKYWLLKSEPNVWSINSQKKAGEKGAIWDGVRNYQAANNLKKMRKGDLCFFYHSNIGKEIVGIVQVIKESFQDPTDKKKYFVAVRVKHKKNTIKLIIKNEKEKRLKTICFEIIRIIVAIKPVFTENLIKAVFQSNSIISIDIIFYKFVG